MCCRQLVQQEGQRTAAPRRRHAVPRPAPAPGPATVVAAPLHRSPLGRQWSTESRTVSRRTPACVCVVCMRGGGRWIGAPASPPPPHSPSPPPHAHLALRIRGAGLLRGGVVARERQLRAAGRGGHPVAARRALAPAAERAAVELAVDHVLQHPKQHAHCKRRQQQQHIGQPLAALAGYLLAQERRGLGGKGGSAPARARRGGGGRWRRARGGARSLLLSRVGVVTRVPRPPGQAGKRAGRPAWARAGCRPPCFRLPTGLCNRPREGESDHWVWGGWDPQTSATATGAGRSLRGAGSGAQRGEWQTLKTLRRARTRPQPLLRA